VALTLRRWLLVAGFGCAVILLAYWPTPPSEPAFVFRGPRRAADIELGNLAQTRGQLGLLERRDAVFAAGGIPRAGAVPVLRIDLALPPAAREALARSFASLIATWQPVSQDVATLLVVTSDSAQVGEYLANSRYFVNGFWQFHPDATDGHLCLSIAFVAPGELPWEAHSRSPEEVRDWLSRAVGSCAFYAAFGKAGPSVEAWLRRRNDALARTGDWQATRGPIDAPVGPPDWSNEMPFGVFLDLMMGGSMVGRVGYRFRGCGSGRRTACSAVLDSSTFGEVPPFGTRYGVTHSAMWGWNQTESAWYLADLVRTVGRERFGEFWRSAAGRDDAFRTAIGQDILDYTHAWVQGRFHRLRVGPFLPVGIMLSGLALTAVLLSATVAYSTRRQVR